MKRVLVTGATGFIGRQALPFLQQLGYEVHATFAHVPLTEFSGVIWHKTDLFENDSVLELCMTIKPTHLLHFAWYVDPKDYRTSPENERWHIATLALLRAFKESAGVRAVLAGSAMEYDPTLRDEFIKEAAATAQHNAYAAAKIRTHQEAEVFATENNLSLAWGRIFNLYGPYEPRERLISQVVLSLLEEKTPHIPTGGLVLDYSYVKDTAGAFTALVDSDVTGSVNVASGNPVSLRQLAFTVAKLIGKEDLVQQINDSKPPVGTSRVVADIQRLRQEVKWQPHYSLEEGLSETIEWWRQNR